jgi:thiol-disulfide isomerase/thioredoxin
MKKVIPIWSVAIFICSIVGASVLPSIVATDGQQNQIKIETGDELHTGKATSRPYNGYLRVYVVEPTSRWDNYDADPYHFGFLDFAINEQLSLEYLGTYTKQVTWNAQQAGYSNVNENNVMVIAAVFNPEIKKGYADPPSKNPFDAYYVDATAGATPGKTGSNFVNETFTHTVFCEEATATWCPYCPAAAEGIYSVYQSGDYPFYFVALIADKVETAYDYLVDDYNLAGYPTAFFDGGYKVIVGASSENTYKKRVETSAKRDVHEMNLSISVVWKGNGVIDIAVIIKNNEEIPNGAPSTPTLSGPNSGKPNKDYSFTVTTTDPEGGQVWYWIDWGDGTNTGWNGPFASGTGTTESHAWTTKENFTITAKAKDNLDAESDWATLTITTPCNIIVNTPVMWLLQNFIQSHPSLFPILQKIIQRLGLQE